jgi:hypothetical protein
MKGSFIKDHHDKTLFGPKSLTIKTHLMKGLQKKTRLEKWVQSKKINLYKFLL